MCNCKAPKPVELIDAISGRQVCMACSKSVDVFRYKDGWETGREKMVRMKKTQTCKQCKKKFTHFMDYSEITKRELCDECLHENQNERSNVRWKVKKATAIKDNKHSPWHRKYKLREGIDGR